MKTSWSKTWIRSKQPRKQRKYRYNAPLHIRRRFLNANLSEALRAQYGKRAAALVTGDKVRIMRGKFKRVVGEVTKIDIKKSVVFVKGAARKKVTGAEVQVPLSPSKVQITELNIEDAKRVAILKRTAKKEEKTKQKESESKK